jgi:hypothetical protein
MSASSVSSRNISGMSIATSVSLAPDSFATSSTSYFLAKSKAFESSGISVDIKVVELFDTGVLVSTKSSDTVSVLHASLGFTESTIVLDVNWFDPA